VERIGVLCADVDVSLLWPSDAGAVMDGGVGAAVADTRIVDDAGVEGGENADPFVAASSSYEACEVDGLIDVGWRFGLEHPLPRGSLRERSTSSGPQDAVAVEGVGVDGPAPPEAFRVQFASVDESAHLYVRDAKRIGGLVDTELGHAHTVEQIR
jgi:hypothetical protein